jgi:hypothetical protein
MEIQFLSDVTKGQLMDSFEELIRLQQVQKKEDSIPAKQRNTTSPGDPTGTGKYACTMVEYSAKAIAVFGDTRSIKNELKAMDGRFNTRLSFNGKKLAGWVFSKSKEKQLACYFGLD